MKGRAYSHRREQVAGYILIAVLLLGLGYLAFWVFAGHGRDNRYRNIETMRGWGLAPGAKADGFLTSDSERIRRWRYSIPS